MASGSRAGPSEQATSLHPQVSHSISLHNAQTVPLPFLSLSTICLYITVALTVGGPRGRQASGHSLLTRITRGGGRQASGCPPLPKLHGMAAGVSLGDF